MNELIDSHAHLDDNRFSTDRDEVILRMRENRIVGVVNPGSDMSSSKKAIALAERYPEVYAAVGTHPHDATEVTPLLIEEYRKLAKHPRVVAIGEIGLDYYYDHSPREVQKEAFRTQLDLAVELDLPVIIHNRESDGDMIEALTPYKGKLRGVIHAFTGSVEMAKRFIDLGFMLGIGGVVTFKNARRVVESVEAIGVEHFLVETDSPYLTPHPHRGKRNEPSMVRFVVEKIAAIKGLEADYVAAYTKANTLELFGIS